MFKKILSFLLPNEKKFYRLIEQLSAQAHLCAAHLKMFVESRDEAERLSIKKSITAGRTQAKKLSAEITRELCSTFITPFDREDIEEFSFNLYKITKTIQKICDRLDLYGLDLHKGDFARQSNLILQEADALEEMVRELTTGHDTDRIIGKINALHELENEGDKMLRELMAALFQGEIKTKDLILRKDIYDMLEKVIDRYRDVANVALQIVLKHN